MRGRQDGLQASPLRDNDNLHIASQPDDLLQQVAAKNLRPGTSLRAEQEDLGDPVQVSIVHQCLGKVSALQQSGLNAQIAREVQMSLNRLPLRRRHIAKIGFSVDEDREAIGPEEIRNPAAAPDQRGGGGIGGYVDQDSVRGLA